MFLLGVDIANNIRMTRSLHSGAFLLVEGTDDAKLYSKFCASTCKVIPAHSKANVEAAITELNRTKFTGALGIIDADFDSTVGSSRIPANVARTDFHDLEVQLVCSRAFDIVLSEFGSASKIQNFQTQTGLSVRDAVMSMSASLGALQLLSAQNALFFTFEDLDFSKFINRETFMLSETSMIKAVLDRSRRNDIDPASIRRELLLLNASGIDHRQLACGHDAVRILGIGLRKVLGTQRAVDVEAANLQRALRLAYDSTAAAKSNLFTSIREWTRETGFAILE